VHTLRRGNKGHLTPGEMRRGRDQKPLGGIFRRKCESEHPTPGQYYTLLSRVRGRPVSFRRTRCVHRGALTVIQLGTEEPSLRHAGPYSSVFGAMGKLGHALAFGRKSVESL
jgi:hypothetical protein